MHTTMHWLSIHKTPNSQNQICAKKVLISLRRSEYAGGLAGPVGAEGCGSSAGKLIGGGSPPALSG